MPDNSKKTKEQVKKELFPNKVGGFTVKGDKATPDAHEVKVVKSGKGMAASTKIIGTDGTVTYEGRDNNKATKDALRSTTNKVNDVVARRANNADYFNNPNRIDPTTAKKNAKNFIK